MVSENLHNLSYIEHEANTVHLRRPLKFNRNHRRESNESPIFQNKFSQNISDRNHDCVVMMALVSRGEFLKVFHTLSENSKLQIKIKIT